MSISLDVALYLRENNEKVKSLSLSDRAVLFTLAFRVGSNPYAWISQEELAKELNINIRNTRRHTSNLNELGLILIKQDSKDKRKNLYQPAEFIINYHQKNRNTYQKESLDYRSKSTGNFEDTGQNRPVISEDTGQNRPVIYYSNTSQVNEYNSKISHGKSSKVTYKSKVTYISKEKEEKKRHKNRDVIIDEIIILPDCIDNQLWSEFLQHRKSIKSPMSLLAQKKAINALEKFKEEGQNVDQIINNSIINGWKGLFPIKLNKENVYGKRNDEKEEFDALGALMEWAGYKSIEDIGPLTSFVS